MPYINIKTTAAVSRDVEQKLKSAMGEAIALIPGKTEKWLMVGIEDKCRLWMGGDDSKPSAFVDVSVLGAPNPDAYAEVTAAVCDALDELLHVPPERVYVKYSETANWGWNGGNF